MMVGFSKRFAIIFVSLLLLCSFLAFAVAEAAAGTGSGSPEDLQGSDIQTFDDSPAVAPQTVSIDPRSVSTGGFKLTRANEKLLSEKESETDRGAPINYDLTLSLADHDVLQGDEGFAFINVRPDIVGEERGVSKGGLVLTLLITHEGPGGSSEMCTFAADGSPISGCAGFDVHSPISDGESTSYVVGFDTSELPACGHYNVQVILGAGNYQYFYSNNENLIILPAYLPADLNRDGYVNEIDMNILLYLWGNTGSYDPTADLGGVSTGYLVTDGVINSYDLAQLLGQWTGHDAPICPPQDDEFHPDGFP